MVNRLRRVLAGGIRSRSPPVGFAIVFGQLQVCAAQDQIRFRVRRRNLERLLRRRHRVLNFSLRQIQLGEIGRRLDGRRLERDRTLVGGNRPVDIFGVLEMTRKQILRIRLRLFIGSLCNRSERRRQYENRSDGQGLHTFKLFHKS